MDLRTRTSDHYRITVGDGRSTEELVSAGDYGYAHSCVISEYFPARPGPGVRTRDVILLEFDADVTADDAIAEAARLGLARPEYEDALYFGAAYPDVQCRRPVIFLHDPWFGLYGGQDVICLWSNAGRRELGLQRIQNSWSRDYRFAFVRRAESTMRAGIDP